LELKVNIDFNYIIFSLWCLCLIVESVEDLRTVLKEVGYSGEAIKEILKWYVANNS